MATTHAVAPRLTTFLRAARGLDDVVDVDAERARRNETLRTTTRRDATTDDTPSVRLARRVLRCEDGREAKDVVKTCRAFVSVVVRMLGSDTMTETESGDAAASAWDAASGFVEVIANERRAVESERGYVADHETARKIFEVREREVRKEMMEALRGALGTHARARVRCEDVVSLSMRRREGASASEEVMRTMTCDSDDERAR